MNENNVIWVTGAKGFLGSEICRRFEDAGYQVIGTGQEISVCEQETLLAFVQDIRPKAIINCAGIRRDATGLSNRIKAYEVNALGARNLALAANSVDAVMVQISSDDVYASKQTEPVNEFDNPHPDTPYGKSKRAGEMMVRDTTDNHIIVRASWLYHANGGSMKKILDAAAAGEKISARTDQFAAPASVALYARLLIAGIEHGVTGTFHVATTGVASRYDFAAKILEIAGYDPSQVLVPEEDPKTAENVVLESLMLEMFGMDIPAWEADLEAYMKEAGLAK